LGLHCKRCIKIKISGQWVFNESELIADAVLAGVGLAYIPEDLVQDALTKGQLVKVLEAYTITFQAFTSITRTVDSSRLH
jgi:DNA-binding transcriptional LysR family regulator